MGYLTDKQAEALGTDAAAIEQLLRDAGRLKAYVQRNENIAEPALRAYAANNGFPLDRLNAALAYLIESGQLFHMPDDVPL